MRPVASATFQPRGERFDPRRLLARPVRALRGGDSGIAVRFAWVDRALEIGIVARGTCSVDDVAWAFDAARGLAGIDDDPTAFLEQARAHPLLARFVPTMDVRLTRTPTVFEAFAEAVLGQLVTSEEARAAWRRLSFEAGALIPGTELRAAPTAAAVRAIPGWRLHTMGVGVHRRKTLLDGASRGETLERIGREHAPEIFMEKLMSMRGVGPWTANHVAQAALGYADAVPVGDLHAPSMVTAALLGQAAFRDDAAMLEALAPFRPHRARVVMMLERAAITPARFGGIGRRAPRPRVDPHRREPWKY